MARKILPVATFLAGLALGGVSLPLLAQGQSVSGAYQKVALNFSNWTKGRFSEAVVVSHPGKFITIAGMGAESEEDGKTLYPGDMLGQCRYALAKIKKALATQGATFADVTRMVTFLTDMGGGTRESAKPYQDYNTCKKEAFGSGPLPAGTVVQITRLASPDMMIEINIDAVRPD
jgi:enamine deaminase RidA (YjgF/YER057c/UK114 family)